MYDLFYIHNLTMDLPTGNIWAGNVALGFRLFLGPWELYDLYEQVTTAGSFLPQNPRGVFKEHFFQRKTSTKSSMKWTLLLQTHPLFHNFYLIHPPKKSTRCEATEKKPWVIQDICYAVPITADKLPRAAALTKRCTFHVCIDHPAALEVGGWGLGVGWDGRRWV